MTVTSPQRPFLPSTRDRQQEATIKGLEGQVAIYERILPIIEAQGRVKGLEEAKEIILKNKDAISEIDATIKRLKDQEGLNINVQEEEKLGSEQDHC